jgi:hypothetical protein
MFVNVLPVGVRNPFPAATTKGNAISDACVSVPDAGNVGPPEFPLSEAGRLSRGAAGHPIELTTSTSLIVVPPDVASAQFTVSVTVSVTDATQ